MEKNTTLFVPSPASPHKQSNLHEVGVLSLIPGLDTLNYSETRTLEIFHMKRERPQWFLYLKVKFPFNQTRLIMDSTRMKLEENHFCLKPNY